jgi:hypothetical protein
MARLGIAPHVADKILNHQSGTISGVAAVYQRHQFLAERKQALEMWGAHVSKILNGISIGSTFLRHKTTNAMAKRIDLEQQSDVDAVLFAQPDQPIEDRLPIPVAGKVVVGNEKPRDA